MRWSIVRLIAGREARDQFRDRRTMFLILGLPLVMYPLFIGIGTVFWTILNEKQLVVGLVGAEYLPKAKPKANPEEKANPEDYPPLVADGRIVAKYLEESAENAAGGVLSYREVPAADESLLTSRQVDALLVIEPDFAAKLERGERPSARVLGREGEENSKLAVRRVTNMLRRWSQDLKAARFARRGLPPDFDSPIQIRDPQTGKSDNKKFADEIRDVMVKVIPLLLVMFVLTGSVHPAVDMTAGEKERGTMETLLISPADRSEIVAGKFLAVTLLSFGTAIWNILLMVPSVALTQAVFNWSLLSLGGLAACVLVSLPIAMLLSAISLALGVFARSTKEGNYYMVPMFFVVLPLTYYSMAPGMELNFKTSLIPVTNALLLQQRLMSVRTDPFPWQHVPAVVLTMSACIGLALWLASRQFHREAVLFREAERSGGRKWNLFGRK
jgi:sodium transport system permease protein